MERIERIVGLFKGRKKTNLPQVGEINWRDEGSIIYVKVKVKPTTPLKWKDRFEKAGNRVSRKALFVLQHEAVKFVTTCAEYEFALVKGIVFKTEDRTCEHVAEFGKGKRLTFLNLYDACLLAEAIMPEMLDKLKMDWVMMMSGLIIVEDGEEKLPIANLNRNIKLGENKIVFNLYNHRTNSKQNEHGLYAFISSYKLA